MGPKAVEAKSAKTEGEAGATQIKTLLPGHLVDALRAGWRDLFNSPQYGLAVGGLYAVAGWAMVLMLLVLGLPYLVYPTVMGFALVAPFAASVLYDVSRRLENGHPVSWRLVLESVRQTSRRDLRWMALVNAFALFLWLDIAAMLFFGFMGLRKLDAALMAEILTTPHGLMFLLIGHAAGAVIAFSIFSISVVSFPMLFDRDVDFVTAMVTSVRTVRANLLVMTYWCVLIAALMGLSVLTLFVGLIVILPLLGHATWHLYRRAIDP